MSQLRFKKAPTGEADFYMRMTRDGRLTIPKLTLKVLQEECDKKSLVGYVLEIALKPASGVGM